MATIVDGRKIAQLVLDQVKRDVAGLSFQPSFCDVVVGDDPVALSYVKVKAKKAKELGIGFKILQLPVNSNTQQVLGAIEKEQDDPHLCGLIVQLPLPRGLDKEAILNSIRPELDADCLGQTNIEEFYHGHPRIFPPTSSAILEILDSLEIDLKNQKILVIGQGELVGKPVTHLLKERGYDVDIADKSTANLKNLTLEADVIISGTGQANLINADMVKPGAVVIDAGTAESEGGIVGDIDTSTPLPASFLSPVPGGVGPLTVAKLFENAIAMAKYNKH